MLPGNLLGGPELCQYDNLLQCYQPDVGNVLNVTIIPLPEYVITPIADAYGTIFLNTPQTVIAGGDLGFTAFPNANYQVYHWLVDGGIAQIGGTTFTLYNINSNHTVEVNFIPSGTIYAGAANGIIYFSMNNGLNWTETTAPSSGNAINSIFATPALLYAGSTDHKVYYSSSNGTTWSHTNVLPDSSSVESVYVNSANIIYAGSANGHVYYSIDNSSWITTTTTPSSSPNESVNSIFITSANVIYVGSEDGNVYYSLDNGGTWIQIVGPSIPQSGTPVQNIYLTANQLFVNTRHLSTNSTLPSGTIDFEYMYSSDSLTNPTPSWSLYSQLSYTFFMSADGSMIYAGTQDGFIYSLTTGDLLGFVTNSPINSIFYLN